MSCTILELIKLRLKESVDVRYQESFGYLSHYSPSAKSDMRYLIKEVEELNEKIEKFKSGINDLNVYDRFQVELLLMKLEE